MNKKGTWTKIILNNLKKWPKNRGERKQFSNDFAGERNLFEWFYKKWSEKWLWTKIIFEHKRSMNRNYFWTILNVNKKGRKQKLILNNFKKWMENSVERKLFLNNFQKWTEKADEQNLFWIIWKSKQKKSTNKNYVWTI